MTTMPFSEEAWRRTADLRRAIHVHPFNVELAEGTLSRERFRHYIVQDALYLVRYSRILALAAARGPDAAVLRAFARSALRAVQVEQALHGRFLAELGVDDAALAASEPAPDCLAYTSYLLATAYHEPWEVSVAALLPCFRIYRDVGCAIAGRADPENPYMAWIRTYADEAFGEAVRTVTGIGDQAAAEASATVRSRMLAAFELGCRYEWLFWDGAYRLRGWPVAA